MGDCTKSRTATGNWAVNSCAALNLAVDDKSIQAILRHSNVGITMNIRAKSVAESQGTAMDVFGAELQNGLARNHCATDGQKVTQGVC